MIGRERPPIFFQLSNVLRMLVRAMTVQGWADAEEELERVAEIVAIVTIEGVGAVVDGELGLPRPMSIPLPCDRSRDVTE